MNVNSLVEAEMVEYSEGAYADHGSARDQLKRFAAIVKSETLYEAVKIAEEELANSNALAAYNTVQRIKALRNNDETK
jgi:hypothetical protein